MVSREPEYQGDGGSYVACDAVISHLLEGEPLVENSRLDVVDMRTIYREQVVELVERIDALEKICASLKRMNEP